jgi:hypothetical protein
MASSYSTDLKLELMVTGENAGTWGDKTNDNLNVIQQAIVGYGEQSIAGGAQTTALTIANSPTLSVARNAVIKFTGTITGDQVVTIPNGIEKTYTLINGTTGAFTVQFKTVGGTGFTFGTTEKNAVLVYSDGTNVVEITNQLAGLVVGTDVQAFDAQLSDIAGLTPTDSNFIVGDGNNFITESGATVRTSIGLGTASDVEFDSLGVGTPAGGTTGLIRATNDVVAFYSSDITFKENINIIPNPMDMVSKINGVYFDWKKDFLDSRGGEDNYFNRKKDVGVIAQEIEQVLPEIVGTRPDGTKAIKYDRLTCLLIECVKNLQNQINSLKKEA